MGSTTVRVDGSLLAAGERLGAGARGIVSSAPGVHLAWASSLVYKQFRPAALDEVDVATLEAMAGYLETLAARPRRELLAVAAWPCGLVEDAARVTGFVMPAIPPAFSPDTSRGAGRQHVPGRFEHLLTGESFLARHRIPLSDRHRYQLLAAVAHALTVFHGHGTAVGDLSPRRILFALDPEPAVYFIGCEAMRFKGRSALPQSEAAQWEVRTVNPGEELGTAASDSHKLGLLALRLLAGNPSLRDPDRLTPSVPRDVRVLISQSLSRKPAGRPAPSDWDGALVTAIDSASTRLPGEARRRADASASTPLSSLNAPSLLEPAPPKPSRSRPAHLRSRLAWWQRRSRLEQAGGVAGAIVVLGVVGLVAFSLVGDRTRQGPITTDVEIGGEIGAAGHGWSRVPHDEAVFGGLGRVRMRSVVAGGPGLVAVGTDDDPFGSAGSAAVWTSEDGQAWSRVAHDEGVFGADSELWMHAVASGESGLVAVGVDTALQVPAVWSSPDGRAWSRVPLDDTVAGAGGGQVMHSVVAREAGFVAVGDDAGRGAAAVWTSEDGRTWVRVPHDEAVFGGAGDQVMRSVAAGGPGLVAVGTDVTRGGGGSAAVWTSEDGLTWSRVPHDQAAFGGVGEQWMASVAAGGPGLVAVGTDAARGVAAVWTSPDGQTWSRVPHDPTAFGGGGGHIMLSVVAGGPGLVAVGADFAGTRAGTAAVWTSEDGQTWSRVPHDPAVFGGLTMWSVVELGPGLVAVGTDVARGGGDTAAVWVGE